MSRTSLLITLASIAFSAPATFTQNVIIQQAAPPQQQTTIQAVPAQAAPVIIQAPQAPAQSATHTPQYIQQPMQPEPHEDRVGNIDPRNKKKMKTKIESKKYNLFTFGPAFLPGYSESIQYSAGIGKLWEVTPHGSIKVLFQNSANIKHHDFLSSLSLGLNYYLSDSGFSPFVGFDFGYGASKSELHSWYHGFGAGASIGLQVFRLSDKQIIIELRSFSIFDTMETQPPTSVSMTLGILY
ncbi:MAG: hypothetical protein OCC49_04405 [Fibrobacterales bacterium]